MTVKKHAARILVCLLTLTLILSPLAFAHPGRTDSRGGHKDNKNASGLGSYHYHCGGHPPHLHEGGICPYAPKDSISVSNMPSKMAIGDTVALSWSVTQYSGSSNVQWSSSDDSVVRIDSEGNLTACNEGTAEITATLRNGEKTFTVTVNAIPVSDIMLEVSTPTCNVGEVIFITSMIEPSNATNKQLEWHSDNENVAIALSDGYVLAIGEGTATISALALDNSHESSDVVIEVVSAGTTQIDSEKIISQLPSGFKVTGKPGSPAVRFAEQCGLPYEILIPSGLPFVMGDRGEAVMDVQAKLLELGFLQDSVDGIYGNNTDAALIAYYESKGLNYDNEVSAEDYTEIMNVE